MSNHVHVPSPATRPEGRTRRPIVRSLVALVVMLFSIGLTAEPILASGGVAPDAPTITGITIGRNAVSVAFTPNGDGGDPITGYTVTCDSSDGGASQSVSDVASPITVSAADERQHVQLHGRGDEHRRRPVSRRTRRTTSSRSRCPTRRQSPV